MKTIKLNCPCLSSHRIIADMMGEIITQQDNPVKQRMEDLFQKFIYQFRSEGDSDFIVGQIVVLEELGVLDKGTFIYFTTLACWYQHVGIGLKERPKWSKLRSAFTRLIRILGAQVFLSDHNGFIQRPDPEIIKRWKEVNDMPAKNKSVAAPASAKKVNVTTKRASKSAKKSGK